jgi:hypothetical protein
MYMTFLTLSSPLNWREQCDLESRVRRELLILTESVYDN